MWHIIHVQNNTTGSCEWHGVDKQGQPDSLFCTACGPAAEAFGCDGFDLATVADRIKRKVRTTATEHKVARKIHEGFPSPWPEERVDAGQETGIKVDQPFLFVFELDWLKYSSIIPKAVEGMPLASDMVGLTGDQKLLNNAIVVHPDDAHLLPEGMRHYKSEGFSTIRNTVTENKLQGRPLLKEQGKRTYDKVCRLPIRSRRRSIRLF